MQLAEGQPTVGSNIFIAVQGKLRERSLRLDGDRRHARKEGTPEVAPTGEECGWDRNAVKEHRQLETTQGREDGMEWESFESGRIRGAQVVQGERR